MAHIWPSPNKTMAQALNCTLGQRAIQQQFRAWGSGIAPWPTQGALQGLGQDLHCGQGAIHARTLHCNIPMCTNVHVRIYTYNISRMYACVCVW